MRRIQRERSQGRRGSAAIEFGFWIVFVMAMLSGIVDFSWYMSRSEIVMRAARDGARHGAAAQRVTNSAIDANSRANATLTSLGMVGCNVNTDRDLDGFNLDYLTTTVDCNYTPLFGMVPAIPSQITYSFTMYNELQ